MNIGEMVRRCREQQPAWARRPLAERLRPVRALRRLLVGECDRLCEAVRRDLGKAPGEAIGAEVLPLADACRFLEQSAARLLRPRRVPTSQRPLWLWGQTDRVHRRPHGLVGVIGTWNYPFTLNGVQMVQALTAGNGVLWKPSEVAPESARVLFELLQRAGYPADLVHLLPATRAAGEELAAADIDHVVFTGSDAVGRVLAANLAPRLVSSTLELSGCDAMFVLEDADVALAAQAAWFGCNINRGQTCIAVRRAFVQRGVYEPFVKHLEPLAAAAQPVRLALAGAVRQAGRLVDEAVAGGGRRLDCAAEADGDERSCVPAVVVDARPEMALCREGSFGPVMAVLPFDTVEDALRMDALCTFGLASSVFTRRPERAAELAARLRTGLVTVNDVVVGSAHPATPFGGRGASGWGVTQGAEGLLEMTVPQVVSVRAGTFRPHFRLVDPKAPPQEPLLRGFLTWGHAPTWTQRLGGMMRVLREFWAMR